MEPLFRDQRGKLQQVLWTTLQSMAKGPGMLAGPCRPCIASQAQSREILAAVRTFLHERIRCTGL